MRPVVSALLPLHPQGLLLEGLRRLTKIAADAKDSCPPLWHLSAKLLSAWDLASDSKSCRSLESQYLLSAFCSLHYSKLLKKQPLGRSGFVPIAPPILWLEGLLLARIRERGGCYCTLHTLYLSLEVTHLLASSFPPESLL